MKKVFIFSEMVMIGEDISVLHYWMS